MKEQLCYVALDPEKEKAKYNSTTSNDQTFEMPDGEILNIGD
jgi:hypothetical protein